MKLWIKIFLITLLSCCLVGCSSKEVITPEKVIYGYSQPEETNILIENEFLEFHFDTETTYFYVVNKENGGIWYSNPLDAENDTIADTTSKNGLRSTLIMDYGTSSGSNATLNNYGYSIEKGIYDYELFSDGIRVDYSIGNIERTYYIPMAVPESRMNEFLEKLEKKQQRQIGEYYRKYDINNLRANDDKNELLKKYPDLETERIYVLRDTIASYLKASLEEMFASVGYTVEDYESDIARYENVIQKEVPVFNISIEYKLVGDELLVSVPMEKITYPEEYPIIELQVLPYFGAGSTEEEGYMVVPDGSGGIINFNNGKQAQSSYYSNMYGWDFATSREALVDETRSPYPVYGISKGGQSFITVLEDGASYATIEADVSRRLHSYNYVTATYTLIHGEIMDISSKSDKVVKVYEEQLPKENLTQRYIFSSSDSYVDMAVEYREYLMNKYNTLQKTEHEALPMAIQIVAATDRVKHRFGFPTTVAEPLTTYKDAQSMIAYLYEHGVSNLHVNYNGWFNEGIRHKVPDKVSYINELGNKKELKELIAYSKSIDVPFYLQSNVEFIQKNSLFDGFNINRDAAKFLSREIAELQPYSSIWYGTQDYKEQEYYLAKPSYALELMELMKEHIASMGGKYIAFGDVGKELSSDLNPKKIVTRDAVIKMQQDKLSSIASEEYSLMFYSGNDYVIPYASFILDMKLDSRGYLIIDEEIPFYQIAIHGLVPYTGEAINLTKDYKKNLLKTIETGASPYYVFMKESVATLQESDYTKYYGAEFDKWKEDAIALYEDMNASLEGTYNSFITNHEKLANGVYKTTFENGTTTIVNYNMNQVTVDGIIIDGQGYYIERGTAHGEK